MTGQCVYTSISTIKDRDGAQVSRVSWPLGSWLFVYIIFSSPCQGGRQVRVDVNVSSVLKRSAVVYNECEDFFQHEGQTG